MFQFYYLYYHLRAFYEGGKYGNQMAPQNKKSLIFQALTLDEKLKEEALERLISKKTNSDGSPSDVKLIEKALERYHRKMTLDKMQ